MRKKTLIYGMLFISIGSALVFYGHTFLIAYASRVGELQEKISSRNFEVEQIEKEIKEYEVQLNGISKEKKTLKNTIRSFDLSIKKFNSDIKVTEKKITLTSQTIEQLGTTINEKQRTIAQNIAAIAQVIRAVDAAESHSLPELILAHDRLFDVWNDVTAMEQLQNKIRDTLQNLKVLKADLEENKVAEQQRQGELENYKEDLNDKKIILQYNKTEKNKTLAETENKESVFNNRLEEKKQKREQFLAELLELESQLQLEIDPSALPQPGSKVLMWPLDDVLVTQYFGETEFAKTTSAYRGKGHNGIDLRASLGTKVKAALSGIVLATGNTDTSPGCFSYGKWVLLRHNNGLSTLYAHLSLSKVMKDEQVNTGDMIGFSGNSGYSTGPHLHFTVYATQGVRVEQFTKSTNCRNATIPIADLKAYLNPLQYL